MSSLSHFLQDSADGFDMQLIGNFLSFASRGDWVGLNQMLREGISPNVQDYDKRTALHLAASEGHASIVELLLAYDVDVNLQDRWQRTVSIFFPKMMSEIYVFENWDLDFLYQKPYYTCIIFIIYF